MGKSLKAKYYALTAVVSAVALIISFIIAIKVGFRVLDGEKSHEGYFTLTFLSFFFQFATICISGLYFHYSKKVHGKYVSTRDGYLFLGFFIVAVLSFLVSSMYVWSDYNLYQAYLEGKADNEVINVSRGYSSSIFAFFIFEFLIFFLMYLLGEKKEKDIIGRTIHQMEQRVDRIDISKLATSIGIPEKRLLKHVNPLRMSGRIHGQIYGKYYIASRIQSQPTFPSYGPGPHFDYRTQLYQNPSVAGMDPPSNSDGHEVEAEEDVRDELVCVSCENCISEEDTICPHCGASFEIEDEDIKYLLENSVQMMMPEYVDPNSSAEIIIKVVNTTNFILKKISFDFSEVKDFFEVDGEINFDSLRPNMEMESRIRIKPLYSKGSFPVKVVISGSGVSIVKESVIKVGGTEVY